MRTVTVEGMATLDFNLEGVTVQELLEAVTDKLKRTPNALRNTDPSTVQELVQVLKGDSPEPPAR
jgi:hypothetical protein